MIANDGVKMPKRSTTGSAGYDFFAPDRYELIPGEWTMIDTGVSLTDADNVLMSDIVVMGEYMGRNKKPVSNWFMVLVPRSGLSNKVGFRIRNTVGIIDMDYRGTIKALVTVDEPYVLDKGERFMQGIVLPFCVFNDEIEPTEVRSGGHGSTGRF